MDLLKESITEIFTFGDNTNDLPQLNIAYGVDKNFLFGAAVSMQSIVKYNSGIGLNFHIFCDAIDNDYLRRVALFTDKYKNVTVKIYIVSRVFIELFPSLKQWSYATFFRLVAFEYLSDTIENILYIDADVICKGSLAELNNIKFDSNVYAAVIRDVQFMQEKPAKRLNIPGLPGNYFNAGVVYLKLDAWKQNGFMHKAIAMLASDPEHIKYKCLDQDILNILFFGHCIYISNDYDCFYGIDYELTNASAEDYKKTITDETKLIHYVGITKPWNDWTNYPCQQYFNDAYKESFWSDILFYPANNEKQLYLKYKHSLKNGNYSSAISSFIKSRFKKYKYKFFMHSKK